MPDPTTNLTEVTDDQLDGQITELNTKSDKTEEETSQLEEAKKERGTRYQKRIDKLTWESKSSKEEATKARDELVQIREELAELKANKPLDPIVVREETVAIGGKSYYTDETLTSLIQAKKMNENEAYKHQRARDKAEILDEVKNEFKGTVKETEEQKIRKEDSNSVLREYPHFQKDHPNFNPEDPLYKQASEIFSKGYAANPRGMSEALRLAKKILGMDKKRPDLSDEFGIHAPTAPNSPGGKKADEELSNIERETAIRQWTYTVNPKTGRMYTEKEAMEKAKRAKQNRRI